MRHFASQVSINLNAGNMTTIIMLLVFFIPGVAIVLGGLSGRNRYAKQKSSQQFEPKALNPFLFILFGVSFFTDFIAIIMVEWSMDYSSSSSGLHVNYIQILLALLIYFTIFYLLARMITFKQNESAEKRFLVKAANPTP